MLDVTGSTRREAVADSLLRSVILGGGELRASFRRDNCHGEKTAHRLIERRGDSGRGCYARQIRPPRMLLCLDILTSPADGGGAIFPPFRAFEVDFKLRDAPVMCVSWPNESRSLSHRLNTCSNMGLLGCSLTVLTSHFRNSESLRLTLEVGGGGATAGPKSVVALVMRAIEQGKATEETEAMQLLAPMLSDIVRGREGRGGSHAAMMVFRNN